MKTTTVLLFITLLFNVNVFAQKDSITNDAYTYLYVATMPSPILLPWQVSFGVERTGIKMKQSLFVRGGYLINGINYSIYLQNEFRLIHKKVRKKGSVELTIPIWLGCRNSIYTGGEDSYGLASYLQLGISISDRYNINNRLSLQGVLGIGYGPEYLAYASSYKNIFFKRYSALPLLELSFRYRFTGLKEK